MRVTGRSTTVGGAGVGTVLAAREGDPRALDELVAASLPLVYNIVGRALDGHPDVDDVVQETLLRVVRSLGELRQPEAYRSWLVAIAIRQVHDREREQHSSRSHRADLETAEQIADPGSDFASLTVLRLGLTDQRRELAEATRWLDRDDRALLALWWLEQSGQLQRAELAEALGLSGRHAAVRVQRMKEQLDAARGIVRALRSERHCAELGELTRVWDGEPSPLWRKRLARHLRGCGVCGRRDRALVPMGQLLGGLPLLLPPAAITAGAVQPLTTGTGFAAGREVLRRGAWHGGRLLPASAAAGAVAAVAVGAVLLSGLGGSPTPTAAAASAGAVPSQQPPAGARPSATASSGAPRAVATPTTTAATRSSAPAAVVKPPAVPVTSSRKGASVWSFNGVNTALAQSGASWYYTWSTTHTGISGPAKVGFVPMIWGPGAVTPTALAQARSAGPYLLGFNEPDMAAQSNMTVDQALTLWPQLMANGAILGSPAVAYGGDTPGGWLDRFMSGVRAKGYRVDFIALHWYGGDFVTTEAVNQLHAYVQAVHDRYHLPVWLTEYALIDFSHGTRFPAGPQQAAFVTASTRMLAGLPYLQRYAWFALPAADTAASTGLFRSGPTPTDAGRAFEAAGG